MDFLRIKQFLASGQDGGIGKTHCASSHNQKKDNNNLKTKNQPELTENRTTRKSNNQGDKEETFIQTGRGGGDRQPGCTGLGAMWPDPETGGVRDERGRQSQC